MIITTSMIKIIRDQFTYSWQGRSWRRDIPAGRTCRVSEHPRRQRTPWRPGPEGSRVYCSTPRCWKTGDGQAEFSICSSVILNHQQSSRTQIWGSVTHHSIKKSVFHVAFTYLFTGTGSHYVALATWLLGTHYVDTTTLKLRDPSTSAYN